MENAMRIVLVERGRDPRRVSLAAFGGAGPVHAARLARSIGIPKVIVPFGAGRLRSQNRAASPTGHSQFLSFIV
jgi:N-methylhydantoinase A/oxoprolinase/acetone carboxylase beta subunit